MNKKVLACLSVMLPLGVFAEVEDLEAEYYRALPGKCIATEDPLNCLESYGYVCHQLESGQIAVAAFYLSCNADLSNGRKHFAQLLFDGVGWAVETQRLYIPDRATEPEEPTEPDMILDAYIRSQIRDDDWFGGGLTSEHMGRMIAVHIENRRRDNAMTLRALCGLVVNEEPSADELSAVKRECKTRILRAIMKLSRTDQGSPFRAAGANEIRWGEFSTVLESNDSAFTIEAWYEFPEGHVSCMLLPHCCSRNGSIFLDSCRDLEEYEEAAVNACLAEGRKRRSGEYNDCLRSNGVKVGCETQADGSRLCY